MSDFNVTIVDNPTYVTIDDGDVVTIESNDITVVQVGTVGPPGPQGPIGGQTVTWQNGDGVNHVLGQAVYLSGPDTVRLAQANNPSIANAVALVAQASISPLTTGQYQTAGVLSGLSGLTADSTYFLSATTAGLITTTPPNTTNQWITEIGVAVSTTEILLKCRQRFVL